MKYSITITSDSLEELQGVIAALNGEGTPVIGTASEPAKAEPTLTKKKVTVTEAPTKKKVSKKRRAVKAAEPELDYATDVRPILMELANLPDGGRGKVIEILSQFGTNNGSDLKVEELPEVLKLAQAALAEADDDDLDL